VNEFWTEPLRRYVWDNAHLLTDTEIAARLSKLTRARVTLEAVRYVRKRLGVRKAMGRGRCEVVSRPLRPGGVGFVVRGDAPGTPPPATP
jgi:hypothetical protein